MVKQKTLAIFTLGIMFIVFGCSGPDTDQPILSAELPLHLEEHLDDAIIIGSEIPHELLAPVEWQFNEPQPGWKAVTPRPFPAGIRPATVFQTDNALQITLGKTNANPNGQLVGGVFIEVPEWDHRNWAHVVIQARSSGPGLIFLGFNVWDREGHPNEGLPFPYEMRPEGLNVRLIGDSSVQTYQLPFKPFIRPLESREVPIRHLGLWIVSDDPIEVEILSITAIPKEALYAQDLIELEVLAFGTSNVQGGRRYISEIADATGKCRIYVTQWSLNPMKPAFGLEGLWNAIQENERDPAYNDESVKQGGKSVREYLESKQWDAIILASHELTSTLLFEAVSDEKRRAEYEALPKCLEYIKLHAPQARLFYYNTYATGPSYDEIELQIVRSYIESVEKKRGKPIKRPFELFIQDAKADIRRCQDACKEFSLDMIPVRQALWLAHVDPGWGYIFTPTNKEDLLEPPHLPANYFRPTLHVGPYWGTGKNGKPSLEYDPHISMAGSYMVGCLIVQALTGEDMIGNTFVPKERAMPRDGKDGGDKSDTFHTLSTDECAILQRIAAKAMKMKDDPPKVFIREYIRMREKKLENKQKGMYKLVALLHTPLTIPHDSFYSTFLVL